MLKKLTLLIFLFTTVVTAEDAASNASKIDEEFISITSNWNQFRELISKPESKGGESEYEKTIRSKLIEITNAPHQALKDAAQKDHQTRLQSINNAKGMAPLINIWTEEWRRAIELRKIQSQVQVTGDADLNAELGKNLQNSINIRESQLSLLQHNQNYLNLNDKVIRRTKHILDLQTKNKNQAQMIEHLKKQLAEAQKGQAKPAKPAAAKKAPQPKNNPKPQPAKK